MASAGPYASLHLAPDRQPHQHPTAQFFTGRMPFLLPNQQRQSTEGKPALSSKPTGHRCCRWSTGQTDGRTPHRYIDPAAHTTQAASVMQYCVQEADWLTIYEQTQSALSELLQKTHPAWVGSWPSYVLMLKYQKWPKLISESRLKKVKVAHTRLPSVGFRSWSRFLAVSLQVTWVINPAVGCHYFPPGLQLPSQPLRGLLPISLLGEQRHDGCEQFA